MNINLFFETILILFAILASNGIIYSFTIYKPNSSENISVITNSSEKDGLAFTSLIASNPIILTSSESSASQTLSVTSSESSASQTLSVTSSDTNVSQTLSVTSSETNVSPDIFDSEDWKDSEINEGMINTENSNFSSTTEEILSSNIDVFDNYTSLDSLTILNSQSFEQWREIAMDLHEMPMNSPAGILQQIKFEELNILYSQDIIEYAITQTELRLIIEHLPAVSLFDPNINHLILTMMSYYHL
uniref:Uncharacterized protein n=1 Tax=Russula foetens TaxID=131541 RepID=A0A2S0U3T5_9AGAM|nr:hypothetical protein [Russula foetens]AWB36145.1 hypothetical protein [Russula foetens]